jgi:hypothetical protein
MMYPLRIFLQHFIRLEHLSRLSDPAHQATPAHTCLVDVLRLGHFEQCDSLNVVLRHV